MRVQPATSSRSPKLLHSIRRRRIAAALVGLVLLASGCTESTGPRTPTVSQPGAAAPRFDGGTSPSDTTNQRGTYSLPHG